MLRALGPRLTEALEGRGVIGRLGGEEVAVFLPSILPREVDRVAEQLRRAVRDELFVLPSGVRLLVTVSIGGAWCAGPSELATLVARADRALYLAKDGGRDRCCLDATWSEPAPARGAAAACASTEWAAAA